MKIADIFKPYLDEMHKHKYNPINFRLCIPKKLCDSIKKGDTVYICPKCALPMESYEEYHCIKGSSNIKINIVNIENWFLTEINNKEANRIHFTDRFGDRRQLINFLEFHYGNVQCNEPLLIID